MSLLALTVCWGILLCGFVTHGLPSNAALEDSWSEAWENNDDANMFNEFPMIA